jgi:hypothetical protein
MDAVASCGRRCGRLPMQDIFWAGLILALLAASLGYAGLCDRA